MNVTRFDTTLQRNTAERKLSVLKIEVNGHYFLPQVWRMPELILKLGKQSGLRTCDDINTVMNLYGILKNGLILEMFYK